MYECVLRWHGGMWRCVCVVSAPALFAVCPEGSDVYHDRGTDPMQVTVCLHFSHHANCLCIVKNVHHNMSLPHILFYDLILI